MESRTLLSAVPFSELAKLTASDPQDLANFGGSVAVSGGGALVGASRNDHMGETDAGSAYVFRLSPEPLTYCTAGKSASGLTPAMMAS